MRKASLLLWIAMMLLAASCVPTNKITYLQESKSQVVDSLSYVRKLPAPYRLQVGDVLTINIRTAVDEESIAPMFSIAGGATADDGSGNPYYTGYNVDTRGEIRMPELGKIKVLGLTTDEVRMKLENKINSEYLKEVAQLYITVKLAGLRYTMVGEVSGTGQKVIFRDQVNVIEAIADGGGVPVTGDLTKVKIVRSYPDGVRTHIVDVTDLDIVYSPYYYIQPNDMIVVDPLPQKALGTGTTGLSSFTTVLSILTALTTAVLLITR
ncbi:polysaccharide biosynthesis/export family protein [Nonlabens ponticola]|uniref:Sugar transporter n=1 Tax=Nonlabens ponticola TaxID=2496866 RepID=A0A3S9MX89_9FLAO|nr:polysaccharide biosynthesis/export family protein [Nonlabens ponticola]AZQ43861.1 sugar transporter [Nonlabens ponticola]